MRQWQSGEKIFTDALCLADRLEGKPEQVVDATVDDHRIIQQFSDAELTAILRRRVGAVPVESEEERPEGEPLN